MTARAGNYIAGEIDHFYTGLPVFNSVVSGGYYFGVVDTSKVSGSVQFSLNLPAELISFSNSGAVPTTGQLWPRGNWR